MSGIKAFLDTNVLIYAVDRRDIAKNLAANELLERLVSRRIGVCSYQVEQEFFNAAFRKGILPIKAGDARLAQARIFGKLHRVDSSSELIARGFDLLEKYRLQWYDSLIVAAALQAQCSMLFSEDFQAGQVFEKTLTVVNPFTPDWQFNR
jgi:predicted nucleic acid-binding protein